MSPYAILFVIPFFFLLIGIEYWWSRRKKKGAYRFSDTITNLSLGIGNQVFNLFIKAFVLWAFIEIRDHFSIMEIDASWWSFILCLLLFDFLFYWAHRWGHEVNFFWAAHGVHHQSEEYNLSVALRQSWFHNFLAFFIFLPIPILGFDPVIFGAAAGIDTVYQFWIHTRAIGKLPRPIEYIFNTPSHHRVHHGRNPKYIDKNHGGVFIIWDRMFGTFQEEEEEPAYGITSQLKSFNPVWANLHYYFDLTALALKMKRLRHKLWLILAPPGWLPPELGGQQPIPEIDPSHEKYEAKPLPRQRRYVLAQFIVLTLGMMAFIFHFEEISTFYQIWFSAILILTTMICGAILEQKKWVISAEYARLGLVVAALNSFYYFWHWDWFVVMLIGSGVGFLFFNLWFTRAWRGRLLPQSRA